MITVAGTSIEIVRGDITEQDVDAIVNAANNHFWMGAGVAGAIKRRGGDRIEADAVSQGPAEVGHAVITTGGKLMARHVIHAAGMGQDLRTDTDKVRAATRSSLDLAAENSLATIAFPAIGTGVGGLSLGACATAMIGTVVNYCVEQKTPFEMIRFVLFDEEAFNAFQTEIRNVFSK